MDYGRITIRNILFALFLGSLAAIWGLHDAKKEPIKIEQKEDIEKKMVASVIPPE